MENEELRKAVAEFEQGRSQLMGISGQKQQLQFQSKTIGEALEELGKTTEKKVYKAVGNILILSDVAAVKKELTEQKEASDLRIKTMQKQEDSLVAKLNKLKTIIESSQKPAEKPSK